MNFLSYESLEGLRKESKLIWIPEEKYMYFHKDTRVSGNRVYLCYQNRFENGSCKSRRRIDVKDRVETNHVLHSNHLDHEFIYEEMKSKSAITDGCIDAAKALAIGFHVFKNIHVFVHLCPFIYL